MAWSTLRRIFLRCGRQLLAAGLALMLLAPAGATPHAGAAILVYHRFGPTVADSMTTRSAVFEAQLRRLRADGYRILPLASVLAGLAGREALPDKAVAITVDDGHRTVYTELLPIIRRAGVPVALFIYPSAIGKADYALTWQQLAEIVASGLVEVHSHTYWHPDFRVEKRRLAADAYRRFVDRQLAGSRRVLQARLGVDADCLAWPYGIHDDELATAAAAAGYQAAFALGERHATAADLPFALPRYLIVDAVGVDGLSQRLRAGERRVAGGAP